MPSRQPPTPRATPTNKPRAGTPTDPLAAYRRETGARAKDPTDAAEAAEREMRERVEWGSLAGIPDLRVVDVWDDTNETYGPYVGTVVRLPAVGKNPSKDVLALTSATTRAGKCLMKALDDNLFANLDGEGKTTVAVTVSARLSRQHPEGRPMVRLSFTE